VVIHKYTAKIETCAACEFPFGVLSSNHYHGVSNTSRTLTILEHSQEMETSSQPFYRSGALAEFPNAVDQRQNWG